MAVMVWQTMPIQCRILLAVVQLKSSNNIPDMRHSSATTSQTQQSAGKPTKHPFRSARMTPSTASWQPVPHSTECCSQVAKAAERSAAIKRLNLAEAHVSDICQLVPSVPGNDSRCNNARRRHGAPSRITYAGTNCSTMLHMALVCNQQDACKHRGKPLDGHCHTQKCFFPKGSLEVLLHGKQQQVCQGASANSMALMHSTNVHAK
jgi:hypothetical protein